MRTTWIITNNQALILLHLSPDPCHLWLARTHCMTNKGSQHSTLVMVVSVKMIIEVKSEYDNGQLANKHSKNSTQRITVMIRVRIMAMKIVI